MLVADDLADADDADPDGRAVRGGHGGLAMDGGSKSLLSSAGARSTTSACCSEQFGESGVTVRGPEVPLQTRRRRPIMRAILRPVESAMKRIVAGVLDVAYLETGRPTALPVILLHGFPYDVHAYDEVARAACAPPVGVASCLIFAATVRHDSCRRIHPAPASRPRLERTAGVDGRAEIPSAVLAGYDWGGRAACIVAALWPERVRGPGEQRLGLQHPGHRRLRGSRSRPNRSTASGTSIISIPSVAGQGSRSTGAGFAGCSGGCGRRAGPSTTPRSSAAPPPSTIPISSMWSSTPTAIDSAAYLAIPRWMRSRTGWRRSPT